MAFGKFFGQGSGIQVHTFILIVTVLNMLVFQWPLYRYAIEHGDVQSVHGLITFVLLLVVVVMASVVLFSLFALVSPTLLKIFLALTTVFNACALYFMGTYRAILDLSMMSNIFNTRSEESLDFLNPTSILYAVLLGVVPAAIILFKIKLAPIKRLRVFVQALLVLLVSLVVVYTNGSNWLWFDKHSKQLGGLMLPWSYTINSARFVAEEYSSKVPPKVLADATHIHNEKVLVLLVVGETARSANFSLYGYERETNPLLSEFDIAVLKNPQSCTTYTKGSLYCMLSHSGSTKGKYEPLPSYLQRNGIDVFWRTKNWGEPPLEIREFEKAADIQTKCEGDFCTFDDILLYGLEEKLQGSSTPKTLIALHTKGSHGPNYSDMYPPELEVFKPACKTVELDKCSLEELVNAYDNTILYTDAFLSRAIKRLEALADTPSVLIYVTDHGESLGENGVYLHGTPNAVAPRVQRDIPFIVWMSEDFKALQNITTEQLISTENPRHEHVFHSVMGAFGLESDVYKPEMDIFRP